jgi:hypothetical protein
MLNKLIQEPTHFFVTKKNLPRLYKSNTKQFTYSKTYFGSLFLLTYSSSLFFLSDAWMLVFSAIPKSIISIRV